LGRRANAVRATPKFLASTSGGVCASQSEIMNVSNSEKSPASNTSRNSQPSRSPWIECGIPAGKNHRSPAPTSAAKLRPAASTAVIRAAPASISDHSPCRCQCSSRMPPGSSRMSTPDSVVATGSSCTVT
jgi:hypothetical protein